jgi:TolA-binding protein
MTQAPDTSAPKMTRVTVRVPRTTLDQINDWVDALGVRRSHFLGIALVAGVRSLMRASALELSLAPEGSARPGAGQLANAAGQQMATPDATGSDEFVKMIEALNSQVASLQAEVADLKGQSHTQQSGKKRP